MINCLYKFYRFESCPDYKNINYENLLIEYKIMEQLLKLKSIWEENLRTSIKLKATRDEQDMILWFLKTIDDSIENSKQK